MAKFPSATTAALRLNRKRPRVPQRHCRIASQLQQTDAQDRSLGEAIPELRIRLRWLAQVSGDVDDMTCCVPLSYANIPACLPLHRMHTRVSDNTCASVTVRRQQHCDMGQTPPAPQYLKTAPLRRS
eukprot:FR738589.1.p2 GENE.FR738589.1~~FR738589.1.p2  ORF type:complete len:127 (-),score=1.40 FR738589.1:57-437(-)